MRTRARFLKDDVRGYCSPGRIVVSRKWHAGFEDMVATGVHELLHAWAFEQQDRPREDLVRSWERRFTRSRALREAMAYRLGNAGIFARRGV